MGATMPRERYRVLHRMNFESPYVDMPNRLTVRQNLKVFGRLYAVEDLRDRIASIAEELDLSELLDRPTGKLSAGQKTRVALAKALDQPAGHPAARRADGLARSRHRRLGAHAGWNATALERNATVLLASHNMAEVERLCERVIIMKRGKIEDDASPAELLARYGRDNLEDVFLDVARGRGEAAREAAQ